MNAARFIISSALLLCSAISVTALPQQSQRVTSERGQTSSGKEAEARHHYQVALVALKQNDLQVAESELQKAADLAPNNALVQYNLAVVDSKSDKPQDAMRHLKRAEQLGLPAAEAKSAETLDAELDYRLQRMNQNSKAVDWVNGYWNLEDSMDHKWGTHHCTGEKKIRWTMSLSPDESNASGTAITGNINIGYSDSSASEDLNCVLRVARRTKILLKTHSWNCKRTTLILARYVTSVATYPWIFIPTRLELPWRHDAPESRPSSGEMRNMMLANDADLSPTSLLKYGKQINLDMTAFGACLNDKKHSTAIQKDVADAGTLGISGTPSFVVGKTAKDQIKGVRIAGAVPYSVFDAAIKNQLNPVP